jgi:hypothetical protein
MERMRASEILHVQELVTISFLGQQALVVFSEDAVAIARNESVTPVPKPLRQDRQRDSEATPEISEVGEDGDDRVRPGSELFARLLVIQHRVHGVEIFWVGRMPRQDGFREGALQGCELKAIVGIALKYKLDEPIAQAADAVVKDDPIQSNRISHGRRGHFSL